MIFNIIITIVICIIVIVLILTINRIKNESIKFKEENKKLKEILIKNEKENINRIDELNQIISLNNTNSNNNIDRIDKSLSELYSNREKDKEIIEKNINKLVSNIEENKNEIIKLCDKIDIDDSIINELKQSIKENQEKQNSIIETINETIKNNKGYLDEEIIRLSNILQRLAKEQVELKKKVEFFAGIEEDSKTLNDESMTKTGIEKEEEKIHQIIQSLEEKPNYQTDYKDEKEIITIEQIDNTLIDNESKSSASNNIENVLYSIENTNVNEPFSFDEYQKTAYNIMENTLDNLFITGGAGTGKSLLLRVFSEKTKKKILKLAPTGIAALHIEGTTIHRAFGFDNLEKIDYDDLSKHTLKLRSENKLVLKNVETIVIDEISMVRVDIVEKIDKILRILNETDKLFGGKQMIFVGDPFQLPPVIKERELYLNEKYNGIYFFDSPTYKKANFVCVMLKINHRQNSDNRFYEILNTIREGRISEEDLSCLNERVVDENDEIIGRALRLFPKKEEVEKINNDNLEKIPAKEYVFNAEIEYGIVKDKTKEIEKNFPFPETLRIKIGANVIFVKNDLNNKWVNGTMGIVKDISTNHIDVAIEGKIVKVEKELFAIQEAKYQNGKISYEDILRVTQFPLTLAYAITIHKSQGMTCNRIACDVSKCFEYGQEYVALSRTTSLKSLYLLSKITKKNISVDEKIVEFYQKCSANSIN